MLAKDYEGNATKRRNKLTRRRGDEEGVDK